ncbi:MAG: hypothetical protein ACPLKX_07030 [Dictyoglomaceae bacterium]
MEWIIILYIIFILTSAIISAIKEAEKGKRIKKIEPVIVEKELEKEKLREYKIKEVKEKKVEKEILTPIEIKPKEEKIPSPYQLEEEKIPAFWEKDLIEKLPEIIILMEILGPPRALQGFGPPYRRKSL